MRPMPQRGIGGARGGHYFTKKCFLQNRKLCNSALRKNRTFPLIAMNATVPTGRPRDGSTTKVSVVDNFRPRLACERGPEAGDPHTGAFLTIFMVQYEPFTTFLQIF